MVIAESFAESFVIAERDPTGKKISRRIDEDCHQPEKKNKNQNTRSETEQGQLMQLRMLMC